MSFNIDTHIAMHGRSRRTERKKGLQAERITLWACSCSSWQAMVTSKNSFSSLMSLNTKLSFKIVPRKTKLFRIGHCCSLLGTLSESDTHFDSDWWGLKKPAARLSLAAGSVCMLKHPAFNYLSLQYQHHLKADQSRNTSQCRVSILRYILP